MFRHYGSFFYSLYGRHTIARVGFINKTFIWKQYHSLVDVIGLWLACHQVNSFIILPSKITLYQHAIISIQGFLQMWNKDAIEYMTPFEEKQLKPYDEFSKILIDADTVSWLVSCFSEIPDIFGVDFMGDRFIYRANASYFHAWLMSLYGDHLQKVDIELSQTCQKIGCFPISYHLAKFLVVMAQTQETEKAISATVLEKSALVEMK